MSGRILVPRRKILLAGAALPVASLVLPVGCGGSPKPKPEAPLAHLYGKAWVSGAYEFYGKSYLDLQTATKERSFEAYRVLAQKGVVALENLQKREVPFYVKAEGETFRVQREVPERLTFSADMSEAEREEATRTWKLARGSIQKDYPEVQRLDWTLTQLLAQLQVARSAIEATRLEQYKIVRQVGDLKADKLPYELPYQVEKGDYENIALLLLERLEDDKARLEAIEGSVVSVGLLARSTDGGSRSLASNLRKILVAVAKDAEAGEARSVAYPADAGEREGLVKKGRELRARIEKEAEYQKWLAAQIEKEREEEVALLGGIFAAIEAMTGLATSKLFQEAMRIWSGGGDYLKFLKLAVGFVPVPALRQALEEGIELTTKVRDVYVAGKAKAEEIKAALAEVEAKVRELEQKARSLEKAGKRLEAEKVLAEAARLAENKVEAAGEALVNAATRRARAEVGKQLAFYRSQAEESEVLGALAKTGLLEEALPQIPGL